MFFAKFIDFLEMTVSKDGVSMDPAKVSTIKDYQVSYCCDPLSQQHTLDTKHGVESQG